MGDEVRPWIRKLTTNYNGGLRVFDLEQRTLVVGPTGSGKSSLLASLGLLLTGTADDAIGRAQVTLGTDLSLAMSEGQQELSVQAELSNGKSIGWTLPRGKRPVASGITQDDWRHPVRVLRDILAKGPDQARIEMAPLLLGSAPIQLARLLPGGLDLQLPVTATPAELSKLIEREAQHVKDLAKYRKQLENNADTLERTLPERPTPEAIEAAERTLTGVTARREEHTARLVAHQVEVRQRETLSAGIAQVRQELAELIEEYGSAPDEPQQIPGALLTHEQVAQLEQRLALVEQSDEQHCPLCGQVADIKALAGMIRQYLGENERRVSAAVTTPQRRTKAEVRAEYETVFKRGEGLQAQLEQLPALPPEPELLIEDDDAARILGAIKANEASWVKATHTRAEALKTSEAHRKAETGLSELKRVLSMVFRERTAAAQEEISRWLPKGWKLHLVLDEGRFRLGLINPNGVTVTNPSGGQRSGLLLAIAAHLVMSGRIDLPGGPVILALPEERGMSAAWLKDVMHGLSTAPVQIVLVSLHKASGRHKGWSTVELDGASGSSDGAEGAGASGSSDGAEGAGASGAGSSSGSSDGAAGAEGAGSSSGSSDGAEGAGGHMTLSVSP